MSSHQPDDGAEKKRDGAKINSLPVFWRLVRIFGPKYWFRLFLGVVAGLIMGGAMHAYLAFLDIGVGSMEKGVMTSAPAESPSGDARPFSLQNIMRREEPKIPVAPADSATVSSDVTEKTDAASGNAGIAPVAAKETARPRDGRKRGTLEKVRSLAGRFGVDIGEDGELTPQFLVFVIVAMLLFFAVKTLGEFVNKYFLSWVGARVVADIRWMLLDHFQRQSMSFFSRIKIGSLISRCTNDAGSIEHAFANCIAELFAAPVQILVAVHFLMQKALAAHLTKQTVVLLALSILAFVPVYLLSKKLRQSQHKVLRRVSDLTAWMQERLSGIREVKAFHREDRESAQFAEANNRYFKARTRVLIYDIFMTPTMQVMALALGAVFLVMCYQDHVTFSSLAVIGYAASTAYRPLKELSKMNTNLQNCAVAAARIFEALDYEERLPEAANPVPVRNFQQEIVFSHVSFSYQPDLPRVLEDFNLTIRKGQHVAIVGATGSGKTTIANLLARFYDPVEGGILLDGHDLREIAAADLRKLVGVVSQEAFLFSQTIRENIAYGRPEATMEEIMDAARRANVESFIRETAGGYDQVLGERGQTISGGQKQRIAIARTLLTNPPILILDEATSALDTVTEQQVQLAITELMKDRTVLSIAHRLSTIIHADKIVVLKEGRIVEQGTHEELYALGGMYTDLYNRQIAKQ